MRDGWVREDGQLRAIQAEGIQVLQATKSSVAKARNPGPHPALLLDYSAALAMLQEQVTSNLFVPHFPLLRRQREEREGLWVCDGDNKTAEKGRVAITCHGEAKTQAEPWEYLPQKRGPLFFGVTYI